MVFAPFDPKGKYHLRPYEQVMKDGIYANVIDNAIFNSIIEVPATFDDIELQFRVGHTMGLYDEKLNELSPAVGWHLIIPNKKK